MPVVSIIIPIYNVQAYLKSCLDSVLSQTFKDFEVICVDDGSTDSSGKIAQSYAQKDNRFLFYSQPNKGVSAARNFALSQAKGSYICFLDSDDFWHCDFLKQMVSAIQNENADMAWCRFVEVPEKVDPADIHFTSMPLKTKVYDHVFHNLIRDQYHIEVVLWNKIYKAQFLKNKKFIEQLHHGEDFVFTYQVLYTIKKGVFVDQNLIYYRLRSNSLTRSGFNDQYIQDYLDYAAALCAYFKNKKMPVYDYQKIMRKFSKISLKACMILPLKHDDKNYQKTWKKYADILAEMQKNGTYSPRYLGYLNRFKSFLFTHKHFKLLNFFMKGKK